MKFKSWANKGLPPLIVAVSAAVALISTGVANAATASDPEHSLAAQIAAAGQTPAGVQVRTQLGIVMSDPALPAAAAALLQSDGPGGLNDLTLFQQDLLKALIIETSDPTLISAELTGSPLTPSQRLEARQLQSELLKNPAIDTLIKAGKQLRDSSSQLSSAIGTVTAGTGVIYSTLTPPPTAGRGGSLALDAVISDVAALRMSSAFSGLALQMEPLFQDPAFPQLLEDQLPLSVASFLPVQDMISLLISHDRDPQLTDIAKAAMEILGGLAGIGAAILLLPEEITTAIFAGTLLAIFAAESAVVIGIIDLGQALDCDHDGDPFDPADVPGQEC